MKGVENTGSRGKRAHGTQNNPLELTAHAKISFEQYALSTKIWTKMYQDLHCQNKYAYLGYNAISVQLRLKVPTGTELGN